MAAKLWKTREECIRAMERSFRNIEFIGGQFFSGMESVETTDAIGIALYREIKRICEGALYLVNCIKADIHGTLDFPRLKDLSKYGDCVDATPEAKMAAKGICDMKKPFEDGPITPGMLKILLEMAGLFLEWAWGELRHGEGEVPDFFSRFNKIKEDLMRALAAGMGFIGKSVPGRLYFRYVGDKDLDTMTDEEIDELYRPQKVNSRKSLASLYIYMILREHTDWDHHFSISDIQRKLEEDYEIRMERKAIGRCLHSLGDEEKTNIWISRRNGYWYSDKKPE